MRTNKILVIASHPDDEILGCGGTISRMINEGAEAYTLILGEGITSRDKERDRSKREEPMAALQQAVQNANRIIGIKAVFTREFPDNRFDSVPILDIVKTIEEIKNQIKPDVIFTQYENDLNIDHQITYRATLTATRPTNDETVKEIFAFETLSSTEWKYPLSFLPDLYVDISATLNLKHKAIAEYTSEIRDFPHPRSLEAIKLNAQYWGMRVGLTYAEAFKTIRVIK